MYQVIPVESLDAAVQLVFVLFTMIAAMLNLVLGRSA